MNNDVFYNRNSKEELLADLKEAMREVRDIQAGKIKAKTMEELLSEL